MRKPLPSSRDAPRLLLAARPAARAADPPKDEKDKKPDPAADINKPRADARSSPSTTSEGTWIVGRRLARRADARLRPARRHLLAADRGRPREGR